VRSESTAQKVRDVHQGAGDRLSFAIVPDISAQNAFDEAVKGVDGVIHTASPYIINAKDFDKELYEPAINGTRSILQAVKQYNPSIKRIVITSSFAAVVDASKSPRPGYAYSEADWNPMTQESVRDNPRGAYSVSKKLAEKAAWDFVESEKPNFSITTLNPPMVYGPLSQDFDSMDKLNTSSKDIWRLINGSEKTVPPTGLPAYVDVRDLAKAHLLAYTTSAAANQRYLVCGGPFTYQKFCDIIRANFPDLRNTTPEGNAGEPLPPMFSLDTTKVKKDLGLEFTSTEKTIKDTVERLVALEKKLSS